MLDCFLTGSLIVVDLSWNCQQSIFKQEKYPN